MHYLLDTSFLIGYLRQEANALRIFEDLIQQRANLYICPISQTQILANVRKTENYQKIKDFLTLFEEINLTAEITLEAGEIGFDYARKGIKIPDTDDLIITAICHRYRFNLVTSNLKHFPSLKNQIFLYKY